MTIHTWKCKEINMRFSFCPRGNLKCMASFVFYLLASDLKMTVAVVNSLDCNLFISYCIVVILISCYTKLYTWANAVLLKKQPFLSSALQGDERKNSIPSKQKVHFFQMLQINKKPEDKVKSQHQRK